MRTISAALALGLCAAGCGDGGENPTAEASPPPCGDVKPTKPRRTEYRAPRQVVRSGEKLTARVRTSCGEFSIALDARRFLAAVNSFAFLARKGFYDGTPFDSAGAGRYLHGGDPPGRAEGPGYRIEEVVPIGFIFRRRIVALSGISDGTMTDGGVVSRVGSQFSIAVAEPWLDLGAGHVPIGAVDEGFDVVDRISRLGPGDPDEPANPGATGDVGPLRRPVAIESISIEQS